ncbi:MAG: AsmA-like C-terminal domain-containing protein [Pseudomonadota bacterium]
MVRAARLCAKYLFRVALVFVVLVGVLVGRLAIGPIQVDALAPIAANQINQSLPGWRVDVGGIELAWRRDRGDVGFTMTNVALTDPAGSEAVNARQAIVELDLASAFGGVIAPTELSLSGAKALLLRTPEGVFRFSLARGDAAPSLETDDDGGDSPIELEPDASRAPSAEDGDEPQGDDGGFSAIAAIVEGLSGDRGALENLAQFQQLRLEDVQIDYIDQMSGVTWRAPSAEMIVERALGGLAASFSASVQTGEGRAPMAVALRGSRARGATAVELNATFANASGEAIASQVPALDAFRTLDASASGSARAALEMATGDLLDLFVELSTQDAALDLAPDQRVALESLDLALGFDPKAGRVTLSNLNFAIDGVLGSATGEALLDRAVDGETTGAQGQLVFDRLVIARDGLFEEPLKVSQALMDFTVSQDAIAVPKLVFSTPDTAFEATARVELSGDDPETQVSATFGTFPATRLIALWPLSAAPGGRAWIEQNIKGGSIESGSLSWRSKGADEDLSVAFRFAGLTGVAVDGMTPISSAYGAGLATLDAFKLNLEAGVVDLGDAGVLALGGSSFEIPDLSAEVELGVVDLRASGPVQAALTLIDQPPLGFLQRMGRTPDAASGDAKIQAALSLPLLKDLKTEEVDVKVTADLTSLRVAAPEINSTITARSAELEVDTATLKLSGSMAVDGFPVWARWTEVFAPGDRKARSSFDVRTRPSAERLQALGAPAEIVREGRVDLRGRFDVFDIGPVTFNGTADLTALGLALPQLQWRKPVDQAGVAEVRATFGAEAIEITFPEVSAGELIMSGALALTGDGAFESFEAAPLILGQGTELNLAVLKTAEGAYRARVRGPKFDLRPMLAGRSGQTTLGGGDGAGAGEGTETQASEALRSVELDLKVDRARLRDDAVLNQAVALVTRRGDGGLDAQVNGSINGRAQVSISYGETAKAGEFAVRASDAGELLRTLGYFDDGYGGELLLSGRKQSDGVIDGDLRIDDLIVRDAPGLAQILSVGTLIGFVDALSSGGITFTKVNVPFRIIGDMLEITDAAATGPSMGLSLGGTVNNRTEALDLQGAVSPAYGVSSLVKNIPLVGNIITGGEGEGIIGASYAVRGTVSNPEISVNPLSVLGIGPFRRLFTSTDPNAPEPQPRQNRFRRDEGFVNEPLD